MKQNGRRFFNFIVDKDLQVRIMAYSIIYMICVTLVILGIVLFPLITDMIYSQELARQYAASQNFLFITKRIVPALLAVFVLFTFYLLIITHRICGPLVNFAKVLARIAEGDLSQKARIRKHDYLKEECDHINDMTTGISKIIERLNEDHRKLRADLENMVIDIDDPAIRGKIEKSLEIIEADAEDISKSLAFFRMSEK
jgi:signal transduction histidine kinase